MHTWPLAAAAGRVRASAANPPTNKISAARRPEFVLARMTQLASADSEAMERIRPLVITNRVGRAVCIRARFPDFSPETPNTRGHTEPRSMCLDSGNSAAFEVSRLHDHLYGGRSRLRTSAGISPASPFGQLLQRLAGAVHRNTGPSNGNPRSRRPDLSGQPGNEERWGRENRVPTALGHRNRVRPRPR
jgi:hypothetical protein